MAGDKMAVNSFVRYVCRYLFLFLLQCWFPVAAQHSIEIRDAISKDPLSGTTAEGTGTIWVADSAGIIQIPGDSSRRLQIRFNGYKSRSILFTPSKRLTQLILLEPSVIYLNAVTVNAYENIQPLGEVPGNVSLIKNNDLQRFGPSSLTTAFNAIPGVRLEERSPGSYRLNIRGSTLRSPYGIRNVKVYMDDIPLTEPTGNTPLNLLDLHTLRQVTTMRGPAASLYGAGYGGIVVLDPALPLSGKSENEITATAGSYRRRDLRIRTDHRFSNGQLGAQFSLNKNAGYRDQSQLERKSVYVPGSFEISKRDRISFVLLYSDLYYQLPGGLTQQQVKDDPRTARQDAIDQHSSVDQQYLLLGFTNSIEWKEGWGNKTTVFYSHSNKENPFITNFETERLRTAGIRTLFYATLTPGDWKIRFTGGTEWQGGMFNADNYGNDAGIKDSLRYNDDNRARMGFEFIQAIITRASWEFVMAGSINHLTYRFDRTLPGDDQRIKYNRQFSTVISPRFGIKKEFSEKFNLFGNLSWGFSPPTMEEIRTSDGNINRNLEAENAINWELGGHLSLIKNRLFTELTLFRMNVNETIVSLTDELGNSLFRNTGSTLQQGLELMVNWKVIGQDEKELEMNTSVTANNFTFDDYRTGENNDFSGNELTGSMPFSYDLGIYASNKKGISANLHYSYGAEIPLNDANSVFSRDYHLIQFSADKRLILNNRVELVAGGGINNILNQKYSLGNDLNAFGDRYFNPAPGRNYFVHLRFIVRN